MKFTIDDNKPLNTIILSAEFADPRTMDLNKVVAAGFELEKLKLRIIGGKMLDTTTSIQDVFPNKEYSTAISGISFKWKARMKPEAIIPFKSVARYMEKIGALIRAFPKARMTFSYISLVKGDNKYTLVPRGEGGRNVLMMKEMNGINFTRLEREKVIEAGDDFEDLVVQLCNITPGKFSKPSACTTFTKALPETKPKKKYKYKKKK